MKTIGMIGLDTSHVVAFCKLLNDPKHEHYVAGGKVTVAFPGGSKDFALSIDRVAGFTKDLQENHQVRIVDSPEAVAEAADLVFIESVDGRVHLDQFRKTMKYKKPTFIDKPMTVNYAEAQEIFRLAQEAGIPLMSCSSLRYADGLTSALAGGRDKVQGVDVFGPMAEQATQPGLFWYGIHTVEMIVAVMGPGCKQIRAYRNESNDLVTMVWADGRIASLRGVRNGHSKFGAILHRADGFQLVDAYAGRPYYASLLQAIMRSLPNGKSDIPAEETLEVIRIIEAANKSRQNNTVVDL